MSAVSQHIQLGKSKEQPYENYFEKVEWLVVNDVNQEYSQSTTLIETATLSNNGKWCDYNKGYLRVPLLMTVSNGKKADGVTTSAGITGKNAMLCGFKQSFLSMINSITLDCNGVSLIQQNQLIDIMNHFRIMTSFSWNDVITKASHIGFYPDVSSIIPLKDVNAEIIFSEKKISGVTEHNVAHLMRMDYINWSGDMDYKVAYGGVEKVDFNEVMEQANLKGLYHSNMVVDNVTFTHYYSINAIIMLKHIHPFFEAIPISKGLNFKFQIFWNNTFCTAGGTDICKNTYRAFNGTNPLLVTFDAKYELKPLEASIYVGDKCLSGQNNYVTGSVGKLVQLMVPTYQMKPSIDNDYMDTMSKKEVKYLDYYQYTIKGIEKGQIMNKLISNGVSKLKGVLIVPLLSALRDNENCFSAGNPYMYGHLGNFNISIGGSAILPQDNRYTYQTFLQNFHNCFGINGNETTGLASGLIGYHDWFKHPYYFVDCSNVPEDFMETYRSVQIEGTNLNANTMDYIVYCIFERSFILNTVTGQIGKD